MRLSTALLALAGAILAAPTSARDLGQWENQPPEVRAWYRNARLTEAARSRLSFQNCCDNADVVRTKFKVNKTDGGDEWLWLDPDTNAWRRVPPDIVHEGEHAPDGQPTLFVYSGIPTCFYPGQDGN